MGKELGGLFLLRPDNKSFVILSAKLSQVSSEEESTLIIHYFEFIILSAKREILITMFIASRVAINKDSINCDCRDRCSSLIGKLHARQVLTFKSNLSNEIHRQQQQFCCFITDRMKCSYGFKRLR